MVRRSVRIVIQLLGGLGAGFAIIFSLLAWQLSQGPISLGFLSEYIESAINEGRPDFSLKLGDTILTWAGWQRALDIRVLDIKVVTSAGSTIGSVPEVSFSLSGDALIRGKFAPRSIELYGPRLSIRRDRDGDIDIGFGAAGADTDSEALVLRFLDRLMAPPSLDQPMSYLSRVAIIGGAVTINDQRLKKSWKLPVVDIRLNRMADRLHGEIDLVLDEQGRSTELLVDGDYVFAERRINLDFSFTDVAPAVFSAIVSDLAPLKAFDMPLSGTVGLSFPIDGAIERVDVAITGATGKLILPSPHQQELAVVSAKLKASFTAQSGAEIETLEIAFAEGTKIQLPQPIDFPEPLRHVSLKGKMSADGRTINVEKLIADIGGPILSLSADLTEIGDTRKPVRITVSGGVDKMRASDLPGYWPPRVGADTRQWIITHIRKGLVENTTFEAHLTVDDSGAHKVLSINGEMHVSGAEVDYLPPMPKVTGIAARIHFDEKTFTINAKDGRSDGLFIKSGRIVLTGLDQYDQFADIDLKIRSSLSDQLSYIDHKPFRFTSALNLNLDNASGSADTRLKLFFIIENDLSVDRVKVWARSTLKDVNLSNIFLGRGIENGQLDVRVDTRGMDVKGDIRIAGIPARLSWRENFSKNTEFQSRYNLRAEISDVRHVRDLGLDMEPFSEDYIRGGVKSDITYTVFAGTDRRLQVNVDITDAALTAPAFGWSKPVGEPGKVEVSIDLENGLVVDIPKFTLTAADIDILGAAKYALDGTGLDGTGPERIDFARIAYGRTEMKGALIRKNDGGWEAGFHGPSFDLSPIWQEITSDDQGGSDDHPLLEGLILAVEFERVWLDQSQALFDVSGTYARVDNVWQTVIMNSRVGKDASFDISIRPRPDGNRDFAMHADNAGAVLKALQLYPNMRGGRLRITGIYDDAAPGQPLKGNITVDDYRVINAPTLAHVVSIMSLTGILDALEGEGLAFQKLEIPFELSQGTFVLKAAKATGTSLGFTASGKVFRHADIIDLKGTVIPAYAINSALGHIPVLGDLFTGGEKGGGVFAATYTMTGPMEKPVVVVNPLSTLAPGFLRNVFGIFGKADGKSLSPGVGDENPSSAQ